MKRSTLVSLALSLGAFALYLASLPPSFAFWDTGELQTVATILGIAHPPACPAFVLLGWLFVHALPVGEAAWRVNAMSALAVALAVGVLYATARRLQISPPTAALVTLGFATASIVWKDATRAEVQDLALLFRVLVVAFAFAYARDGRARDLFFSALALGLAGATHGTAILMLPAFALIVVARLSTFAPRGLVLIIVGVALGLVPYVYLPLRSAWLYAHAVDPTLALGLPPGEAFWDYDHPATARNFLRVITGADFDIHSGFAGFLDVRAYPHYATALWGRLAAAYGLGGAALALVGVGLSLWSRRRERFALLCVALAIVPYTEAYSALQDPDRYYLIALWCAAIFIGIAVDAVARIAWVERFTVGRPLLLAAVAASFLTIAPGRLDLFEQRSDYGARTYVRAIAGRVPDGSIVVADWAYSTPLAYAAYAEGTFGKRIVIAASASQHAAYYRRWLATRRVYAVVFDDALALPGFTVTPVLRHYYNLYRIDRGGVRS